jgi:hypothetical protein
MPNPKIRYLYANRYAEATTVLTASSESSALPVKASQNPDRSYVFRSGTVGVAVTVEADLGAVRNINAIAAANVRLFTGGVLEVYQRGTGATAGAAVLVATMPAQDALRRTTFAFVSTVSARHWQFKFTNPGLVSGYVEMGYAFLGEAFQPSVNVRVPLDTQVIDPSVIERSVDGQKSTTFRTNYDAGNMELFFVPTADAEAFATMQSVVGVRLPFFMVLDDTLSWTAWLAAFTTPIGRKFEEAVARYTVTYGWEEIR